MDTKALIDNLRTIAKLVLPLVPGGGAAVEIAETIIKAIDATGSPVEGRAELEAAVNAHADRTADSLG